MPSSESLICSKFCRQVVVDFVNGDRLLFLNHNVTNLATSTKRQMEAVKKKKKKRRGQRVGRIDNENKARKKAGYRAWREARQADAIRLGLVTR